MHNDRKKAVLWAKEHWHVAAFACACLPIVAAVLVSLGVMTTPAAVAAVVASVAYVLITTWQFTRPQDDNNPRVG